MDKWICPDARERAGPVFPPPPARSRASGQQVDQTARAAVR